MPDPAGTTTTPEPTWTPRWRRSAAAATECDCDLDLDSHPDNPVHFRMCKAPHPNIAAQCEILRSHDGPHLVTVTSTLRWDAAVAAAGRDAADRPPA